MVCGAPFISTLYSSVPNFAVPRPNILDLYVLKLSLRIFALSIAALLGLFYISTFIDLSSHLFKGRTTGATILVYFWHSTPQYLYFIIPLAVEPGFVRRLTFLGSDLCDYNAPLLAANFSESVTPSEFATLWADICKLIQQHPRGRHLGSRR